MTHSENTLNHVSFIEHWNACQNADSCHIDVIFADTCMRRVLILHWVPFAILVRRVDDFKAGMIPVIREIIHGQVFESQRCVFTPRRYERDLRHRRRDRRVIGE